MNPANYKSPILIVEDDTAIRQGLVDAVESVGFKAVQTGDGTSGLELALTVDCDLILLDLVLPGIDGLDILREVRASRPTLPVIILTARGLEKQRVTGLRLGADDYVVKPFSLSELLARIDAVLRRSCERPVDIKKLQIGQTTVCLESRRVSCNDAPEQHLTENEALLLRYLAVNRGRVITRDEILHRVWRLDPRHLTTRTVDMTILRLREKLGLNTPSQDVLITVRGKGYMFREAQ